MHDPAKIQQSPPRSFYTIAFMWHWSSVVYFITDRTAYTSLSTTAYVKVHRHFVPSYYPTKLCLPAVYTSHKHSHINVFWSYGCCFRNSLASSHIPGSNQKAKSKRRIISKPRSTPRRGVIKKLPPGNCRNVPLITGTMHQHIRGLSVHQQDLRLMQYFNYET